MTENSQPEGILSGLNPEQFAAATHESGPLMILAGAGSGKTRTITHRIAWLIGNRAVHPSSIMAVTFTNKAAQEMRDRVRALVGSDATPGWMGTFHSVCLRLLRIHGARLGFKPDFVVYDDDDSERLLKLVLDSMGIPRDGVRQYSNAIDRLKNDGVVHPPEAGTLRERAIADIFKRYQAELFKAGAMDFGDLLVMAARLLRENDDVRESLQARFSHLIVDEFQDTNLVQYDFLKLLCRPDPDICVVGDDDQSIYSWRGARVSNILDFATDFPGVTKVVLGRNYRSSANVLGAASGVIRFNRDRYPKDLQAVRGIGEKVYVKQLLNEAGEAAFVVDELASRHRRGFALSRMAVFYRTNAQSRVFEDTLRRRKIPYRVIGGMRFYHRAEIKDIISYLRLLVNPMDSVALDRVVNVPARGIGKTTMDKVRAHSDLEGIPLMQALAEVGDQSGKAVRARIRAFVEMICDLASFARQAPARDVVERVMELTGYRAALQDEDTEEARGRLQNLDELLNSVQEFSNDTGETGIAAFLDRVALVQPLDDTGSEDAVNLMTVHAAKGLEFDCVFVSGLEQGLFPLQGPSGGASWGRQPNDRAATEEERRLMYVAMTRAREVLYLTCTRTRMFRGFVQASRPSVFFSELPTSFVSVLK
ncbi:MAG TPA: UvrD-helicase domain-containing protein [Myxococcota bacterium]|nr:UvrD-helicase domain-containing protein [Myxococcota bacterium]HOA13734.1 UvrD-helicase domain-containing protein [Myxococcota bacterium]HOH77359.1 UvrD-helicase domain-containing protein [Myxococcota bacterium]HPV04940.1 UvrD-helicase domain-containing protein [Myxococcota bacterium]